jgi:phenylacetic acid degradation operon negative regulatory protein
MKPKGPNARKLILGLLLATDGAPLNVRDAITACALFDITENNVRVTLVRLSADGLIRASGRGAYVIGPNAEGLNLAVSEWRTAERRVSTWAGRYVLVHTGNLSRRDRTAVEGRERALHLLGLRELERGLFVRPDNLRGGVPDLRQRLMTVGLDSEAAVFGADAFDDERQAQIAWLWDGAALSRAYVEQRTQLEAWLARSSELEHDVAARKPTSWAARRSVKWCSIPGFRASGWTARRAPASWTLYGASTPPERRFGVASPAAAPSCRFQAPAERVTASLERQSRRTRSLAPRVGSWTRRCAHR